MEKTLNNLLNNLKTNKMKNIHVLPTDKPSRLYFYKGDDTNPTQYGLRSLKSLPFKYSFTNQHIYITSDEVKKNGEWVLSNINEIVKFCSLYCQNSYKKIILTTNLDLIKDGVQSIDDDFLEWFVKNPSCEEVDFEVVDDNIQWYKIINPRKNFYCGDEVDYGDKCSEQCDGCVNSTGVDYGYLTEEPKQETLPQFGTKEFNDLATQYFGGKLSTKLHKGEVVDESYPKEFKQETLEDIKLEEVVGSNHCRYSVIENKLSALYRNQEQILKAIKMLNNGQQRSYNEEETKQLAFDFYYDMSRKMNVPENLITENMTNLDVWFEQYKKK